MNIDSEINDIRTKMFKLRFKNELDKFIHNDTIIAVSNDRLHKLGKILNEDNNTIKVEVPTELDTYLNTLNKQSYLKKWNRLSEFYKINRVEEYITRLTNNKLNKNKLIKKLTKLIDNNQLKSKQVKYDHEKGIIIHIEDIFFNEKNGLYTFKN